MDPLLILPEEIHDEIFSYLSKRDILEASLVSKHWYNIIGHSTMCMRKLCLYGLYRYDYHELLSSNRQYRALAFLADASIVAKNTKQLRMMREIVTKFSKSLVFLLVTHDLKVRVDLPKLQILYYFQNDLPIKTNLIASNGLITKAKNLMNLIIFSNHLDEKSFKYLKDNLKDNEKLKHLKITDINIIKELNKDAMKLNLEAFHFDNYFTDLHKSVIQSFLNIQASSLKCCSCPFDMEYISSLLLNLSQLQILRFICSSDDSYEAMENEDPNYPVNYKISKIILTPELNIDEVYLKHLYGIISRLPNLHEIQIYSLDQNLLTLVYNCSSIKVVRYYLSEAITQVQRDEMARNERIKFTEIKFPCNFYLF